MLNDRDREVALTCVKHAAEVLSWFGLPDYTEGWDANTIGRKTKEKNILIQDMNATELDKVYDVLEGLRDSVQTLMDEIYNLSTLTE